MKTRIYTSDFKNILDAVDVQKLYNDSPSAFADFAILKNAMEKKRLGKDIIILDLD